MRNLFLSLALLLALPAAADDLQPLVDDAAIFDVPVEEFAAKFGKYGGKFTSNDQDTWRIALRDIDADQKAMVEKRHTLLGQNVTETLISFAADKEGNRKLSAIKVFLYNRGDFEAYNLAGPSTAGQFTTLVDSIKAQLETKLGAKAKLQKAQGAAKEDVYHWYLNDKLYRLDVSFERKGPFRPEYISFTVEDRRGKGGSLKASAPKAVSKMSVKQNVKKEENGDVWISVPMVDQGQKGYCACATTARLMMYFGRDADQHEIAQLADAGNGGTNPEELVAALKKIRAKMNLTVKDIYNFEEDREMYTNINKFLREKKVQASVSAQNVWQIFGQIPPSDLLNLRTLKKGGIGTKTDKDGKQEESGSLKKFRADIKASIDAGVPLGWGLMLGLYAEEGKVPQSGGGHMRTIIGYNKESDELIFSDSWGAGHEKKKMKMTDAFAATMMVLRIEPK